MRKISIIIILSFLLQCKKTKLEGDLSELVGTWEWQYAIKTSDICNSFTYDSLVVNSPSLDGFTYSLDFKTKGKLITRKNGKSESKYRLVLDRKVNDSVNGTIFYFKLNNKKNWLISLNLVGTRLYTQDFPKDLIVIDGCQGINSVFEKVN